jgi:hypothetical protein
VRSALELERLRQLLRRYQAALEQHLAEAPSGRSAREDRLLDVVRRGEPGPADDGPKGHTG